MPCALNRIAEMADVVTGNPFKAFSMKNKRTYASQALSSALGAAGEQGEDTPHKSLQGPVAALLHSSKDEQDSSTMQQGTGLASSSSKSAKQSLRASPRQSQQAPSAAANSPGVARPGKQLSTVAPVGMREKLGEPVQPLRLIIVGHNPSEETWRQGHAYAHPSNHMWRLLIKTGIAPVGIRGAADDDKMPALAGVGFSDVGTGHPGTDSSAFKSSVFQDWSRDFYKRMRAHIAAASAAIGCTCGTCGAPALVAFSGKRHYMELVNLNKKGASKVKTVALGLQPPGSAPADWPFPASTEIWVCCSTSGASPMTAAQREAPYQALATRLEQLPWPPTSPRSRCCAH